MGLSIVSDMAKVAKVAPHQMVDEVRYGEKNWGTIELLKCMATCGFYALYRFLSDKKQVSDFTISIGSATLITDGEDQTKQRISFSSHGFGHENIKLTDETDQGLPRMKIYNSDTNETDYVEGMRVAEFQIKMASYPAIYPEKCLTTENEDKIRICETRYHLASLEELFSSSDITQLSEPTEAFTAFALDIAYRKPKSSAMNENGKTVNWMSFQTANGNKVELIDDPISDLVKITITPVDSGPDSGYGASLIGTIPNCNLKSLQGKIKDRFPLDEKTTFNLHIIPNTGLYNAARLNSALNSITTLLKENNVDITLATLGQLIQNTVVDDVGCLKLPVTDKVTLYLSDVSDPNMQALYPSLRDTKIQVTRIAADGTSTRLGQISGMTLSELKKEAGKTNYPEPPQATDSESSDVEQENSSTEGAAAFIQERNEHYANLVKNAQQTASLLVKQDT